MSGIPLKQYTFFPGQTIIAENRVKIRHLVNRIVRSNQRIAAILQIVDDLLCLIRGLVVLGRIDQQARRIFRHILG